MLWHGVHLDFRTATRRLRKSTPFKLADSSQIDIYYPTPRRITRDFAPYFKRTYIEGLGIILPTSDAYGVVEKRARLLRVMQGMDGYVSRVKALAVLADHYWIEFERVTPTP
jgi:hypothetical protein